VSPLPQPLPHRPHPGKRLGIPDDVAELVGHPLQLLDGVDDRVVDRGDVAGLEPGVDVQVFRVEPLVPAVAALDQPDRQDLGLDVGGADQLLAAEISRRLTTGGVQ
jgi:hypothetical protein